jgi:chromate transporter
LNPEQIFIAVLISNLIGFGGLSSLPILRGQILSAGLPADTLLLQSLTIGQISPGPNGLYLISAGYFIGGLWGVAAATLGIVLPPVLVLPLERLRSRLLHLQRFRAVMHSLAITMVALLAVSSITLVQHAATDLLGAAMVIAGTLVLLRGLPSLYGILIAIVAGLVIH